MEQKIKILVQSISQAVGVVVQNSSSGSSQTGHALVKVHVIYYKQTIMLTVGI